MTSVLKLDWTLLMEPNIGSHGLQTQELTDFSDALKAAHKRVKERVSSNELGFWTLPERTDLLQACAEFCDDVPDSITDILVLGIGGSSLGPRAISDFAEATGLPFTRDLHYVDNADPTTLHRILGKLVPQRTLVVVTSKSGTTVETMVKCSTVVWDWLQQGVEKLRVLSTRSLSQTRSMAFCESSPAKPTSIPCRFPPTWVDGSACSLPLAFCPSCLRAWMQKRSSTGRKRPCRNRMSPIRASNHALLGAGLHYLMDQRCQANQTVLMPYADSLRTLGDWFVQLWGESLGKPTPEGPVGPTPLRAVGSTDQHSLLQLLMEGPTNKVIWFVEMENRKVALELPPVLPGSPVEYLGGQTMETLLKAERKATALALANEGRPSATIYFEEESLHELGAFLFVMEAMTAFAGELYGINAFDQPGVEAGKILTNALMGKAGFEQVKSELEAREASSSPTQLPKPVESPLSLHASTFSTRTP